MKNILILFLILSPILFIPSCCCKDDNDCSYPYKLDDDCNCKIDPNYMMGLLQAQVNNGSGAQTEQSTDATVTFSNDSTEIDASFDNNQWLWFSIYGQATGTYPLAQSGNISIYNSSTNTEYFATNGTIIFSTLDKAAKKITGTFDNMKLVSQAGDSVIITNGTFNIDN